MQVIRNPLALVKNWTMQIALAHVISLRIVGFGVGIVIASLKGRIGERINAVLAAAGHNFGLLLRWLAEHLCAIEPSSKPSRPETSLEARAAQVLHERLGGQRQ